MAVLDDYDKRSIRLTDERRQHMESNHPEMKGQIGRIGETLANPDKVVRSRTDSLVELFYRFYPWVFGIFVFKIHMVIYK